MRIHRLVNLVVYSFVCLSLRPSVGEAFWREGRLDDFVNTLFMYILFICGKYTVFQGPLLGQK